MVDLIGSLSSARTVAPAVPSCKQAAILGSESRSDVRGSMNK
jgi:hypothetical protein